MSLDKNGKDRIHDLWPSGSSGPLVAGVVVGTKVSVDIAQVAPVAPALLREINDNARILFIFYSNLVCMSHV